MAHVISHTQNYFISHFALILSFAQLVCSFHVCGFYPLPLCLYLGLSSNNISIILAMSDPSPCYPMLEIGLPPPHHPLNAYVINE